MPATFSFVSPHPADCAVPLPRRRLVSDSATIAIIVALLLLHRYD